MSHPSSIRTIEITPPHFVIKQTGAFHYKIDYYFSKHGVREPEPVLLTYLLNAYVVRRCGPLDPSLVDGSPELKTLLNLLINKLEVLIAVNQSYFTFQVDSLYLLDSAVGVQTIMDKIKHEKGIVYRPLWRYKLNEIVTSYQ